MPFRSSAQRGFMYAKHPEIAKRWQKHTPKGITLPDHVEKKSAVPGITIKEAANIGSAAGSVASAGKRGFNKDVWKIILASTLAPLAGVGAGHIAAKLTSPTSQSVMNLQKKELLDEYAKAIETVKARLATQ